jgi:hypothetical protein
MRQPLYEAWRISVNT